MNDVLSQLSPADITALLASKRTRGQHPAMLNKFLNSGEAYCVISDLVEYQGKDASQTKSLKNNLSQIVARTEDMKGVITFVIPEDSPTTLIAVNLPLHFELTKDSEDNSAE